MDKRAETNRTKKKLSAGQSWTGEQYMKNCHSKLSIFYHKARMNIVWIGSLTGVQLNQYLLS